MKVKTDLFIELGKFKVFLLNKIYLKLLIRLAARLNISGFKFFNYFLRRGNLDLSVNSYTIFSAFNLFSGVPL